MWYCAMSHGFDSWQFAAAHAYGLFAIDRLYVHSGALKSVDDHSFSLSPSYKLFAPQDAIAKGMTKKCC